MTKKIPAFLLLILALAEIALVSVGLFSGWISHGGIVPILDWETSLAYPVLWVLVPLVGSILAVLLIPRILTPIFMAVKKLIRRGYQDGYVPIEVSGLKTSRLIMRLVYTYLLIVGLFITLMTFVDPELFLPANIYSDIANAGLDPHYHISYIFCLSGIAAPIAVALWSVGWALEDAALLHYKLPSKDAGELYEIEPVYRSYSSYLKGFAGFSTVLSLMVIFNAFMSVGWGFDAISVFLVPFHAVLVTVPAYFLFTMIGSKWLRKNKRPIKQMEESDLDLYAT